MSVSQTVLLLFLLGLGFCDGKSNGDYRDPGNCYGFVTCSNGTPYKMKCPSTLKFNDQTKRCDWPQNVQCHAGNLVTLNTHVSKLLGILGNVQVGTGPCRIS